MRILLIIVIFSSFSFSQLRQNYIYNSKFSYAAGFKTSQILGNHPAKDPLRESLGGGFRLMHNGLELRSTYYIDDKSRFRIPLNLDFTFWRSSEILPLSTDETISLNHESNQITLSTGFNYAFAYFFRANAWVYSGLEITGTLFTNPEYAFIAVDNLDPTNIVIRKTRPKDGNFRIGTNFRLGAEAELHKSLMINFSANLHLLNLLGRNENNGQLLVINNLEKNEDYLFLFQFSLMFQYRL
jgi:hypothetical protein